MVSVYGAFVVLLPLGSPFLFLFPLFGPFSFFLLPFSTSFYPLSFIFVFLLSLSLTPTTH
jgi:maltodextrin utilization protein YvdJ